MSEPNSNRRKLLLATGAALTAGLAGCGGGGDGDSNDSNNGDGSSSPTESANNYLSSNDANAYDGSLTDETGSDSVTVKVGTSDNPRGFVPAGVKVSPGTTVTWEWTGNGGQHNVKGEESPDGGTSLDSGSSVQSSGETYEETLETAGAYNYFCTPHKAVGMYGAVVVEDSGSDTDSGGNTTNSSNNS